MAKNDLEARRARYFTLSSEIARIDTAQLRSLLDESEPKSGWWSTTHTLDIARTKVFVKRIPVADLEYENMFSTRNLYELPTCFNYGVGSAGFGVFRELAANIETSKWVLEGEIANFPLLYHHRIVPVSGPRPGVDLERHRRYVEYWNNDASVGRYMSDRAQAKYELVLFQEHLPYNLEPWLRENPTRINRALEDLLAAIAFLRTKGIVHFDVNFDNLLSDGERAYLTDFGLVLDEHFTLAEDEAVFLRQNTHYDYGELLWSFGFLVHPPYEALADDEKKTLMARYGIKDETPFEELIPVLLDNIEEIHADGAMKLDDAYVASIVQYRGVIALFHEFFYGMRKNNKKDTRLNHAKLTQLLRETDILTTQ